MTLETAIRKALDTFGMEIIHSNKLVFVLDDYGAFCNTPAHRNIIRTLIQYQMLDQCLQSDSSTLDAIIHRVNYRTGIEVNAITEVVRCFREVILPKTSLEDDNNIIEQELKCICRDGKWGYINEHNEIIVPFKYTGLSVITKDGVYAAATGKREFYDSIDRDIYWDGVNNVFASHDPISLMIGDLPIAKGVGHHYLTVKPIKPIIPYVRKMGQASSQNHNNPESKEVICVTKYADIPDSWILYNEQHQPISKAYSNIFLCNTEVNSLKKILSKISIHPMFFKAKSFQDKGMLLVKQGRFAGKPSYGVISITGKEIIEPRIWTELKLYENCIIAYCPGHVRMYPIWAEFDFSGLCRYEIREEWLRGKQYSNISLEPGGLINVNKGDFKGILNCNGDICIPIEYNDITHLNANNINCFVAFKNFQITVYDENFKIIYDLLTDNIFSRVTQLSESRTKGYCPHLALNFFGVDGNNNRLKYCLVINREGQTIIPFMPGLLKEFNINGWYTISLNRIKTKYDFNGNIIDGDL